MKRAVALGIVALLCLCVSAQAAQVLTGPVKNTALSQQNLQILRNLNRNELLRNVNKLQTLEGVFYDGSIPMIVESLDIVRQDAILPPDKYVPIVGPVPTGLKWGDKIRVQGTIKRPGGGDPPWVRQESLFVQVQAAGNITIATPGTVLKYDPSRFRIVGGPVITGPVLASKKYAVLISGGASPANNHIRYWNDLKTMYGILKNRGYNAANIYVIYADGVAKDGDMPVNYSATKANINTVFSTLQTKLLANDTVYVMLNDHGGNGSGDPSGDETVTHTDEVLYLWGENPDHTFISMTDDEFAVQMNKIPASTKVTVQMKQCYSGGYIDDLTRPNRIIMSSASATQVSYGKMTLDYGEFTFWYFTALTGHQPPPYGGSYNADANGNGSVSIMEAWNFARDHDGAPETPHYEDNGAQPAHSGAMPAGGEGTLGAATYL